MSNLYYTHTTFPVSNTNGSSASMRGELNAIMAGFDLLPDPIGVGSKGFTGGRWEDILIAGGVIDGVSIGDDSPGAGSFTTLDVEDAAVFSMGATLAGILAANSGTDQITGFKISGGAIDNVPIGATTPSTVKATTLSASGAVTFTGALTMTGGLNLKNQAFELGDPAAVGTPFIDLHSSGASSDYDARIIASGGSGTAGQGTLTFTAGAFSFNKRPTWVSGFTPWDNNNLASPFQTTGGVITSDVYIRSGSGNTISPGLRLQSNNGAFTSYLRAQSVSNAFEIVNSANSAVNLGLRDSDGYLSIRGGGNFGARPTWAGVTPWDNGNLFAVSQLSNNVGYLTSGGTINLSLNSQKVLNDAAYMSFHWNNIGANPTYLWVSYNDAANTYLTTPGSLSVNFANSASFASSAGSVGGVSNPATNGSNCVFNSGVAEWGPIFTAPIDLPNPWTVVGWRTTSDGNWIAGHSWLRGIVLRNQ